MGMVDRLRAASRGLCGLLAAIGAVGMSGGSLPAGSQPVPLDSLFGIRLGHKLEAQLKECPKNDKGEYDPGFQKTDAACWVPLQYGKEVRLPQKIYDESRVPFLTPKVTTREGVVVEIDIHAFHDHWRDMERYLIRAYGKPHQTNTYKTDSRVFGLSGSQTSTWRANGIALYFDQGRAGSHARIRMVNEAWDALDAKETEERRQRLR